MLNLSKFLVLAGSAATLALGVTVPRDANADAGLIGSSRHFLPLPTLTQIKLC